MAEYLVSLHGLNLRRGAVGVEELAKLGGQLVPSVVPGLLEGRGESVGERPDRAGSELVARRDEVVAVN